VLFLGFLKSYSHYYKQANAPEPQTKINKTLNGTLEKGAVYNELKELQFSEAEIANIIASLEKIIDPRILNKKDSFFVSMSTKGDFQRLVITHEFKRYCVAKVKDNRYVSREIELEILENQKSVAGIIESSLWNSMISQGISPQVIMEFSDVFVWNIDFLTEVRPQDKYAIVWDEKTTQDGQIVEQKILAAYYLGKKTDEKEGFLLDKTYYDLQGGSLERMFLRAPLSFKRITSHFSKRRFHPILKIYRQHHGTDYSAPRGTPVSCVAKGKITFIGRKRQLGKHIRVKHDFGYETIYGHLNSYAKNLKMGSRVGQGQIIGYVGSTGLASGPHLHFSVKQNRNHLNFERMKNRASKGLAKSKLGNFKKIANNLKLRINTELKKLENAT
jgi:murein DD-endopeptidase MepM/ murein hydrolase activator NlpD